MFLHNHLSYIFAAHAFTLESLTVLQQCSHCESVAVDEGSQHIALVYCDPFYELVLYSY